MEANSLESAVTTIKPKRIIIFGRAAKGEAFSILFLGSTPDPTAGNAITIKEVVGWFREAGPRWRAPGDNSAALPAFVQHLNLLRTSEQFYVDVADPKHERQGRLQKAIHTLVGDLPGLMQDFQVHRAASRQKGGEPLRCEEQDRAVAQLYDAARQVAQDPFFSPVIRTKHESWHDAAAVIEAYACVLWRAAGRDEIGKNPTSPLVKLIALALPRIGEGDRSPEAISKALRRRHRGAAAEIEMAGTI